MFYREVDFKERQPGMTANVYFYKAYSGGHTYGYYNGYVDHMKGHLKNYPDHTLVWLEPESEQLKCDHHYVDKMELCSKCGK